MNIPFSKRNLWVWILVCLVIVNLVVYWPRAKVAGGQGGLPAGKMGEETPAACFEAAMANLPEAARKKLQERLAADRAFFESVKDLPEAERRQKILEHFAQNPPPELPGMALPGPPPLGSAPPPLVVGQSGNAGGASGPPGGGLGPNRLPDPEERQQMDRQIVNSRKNQHPSHE